MMVGVCVTQHEAGIQTLKTSLDAFANYPGLQITVNALHAVKNFKDASIAAKFLLLINSTVA